MFSGLAQYIVLDGLCGLTSGCPSGRLTAVWNASVHFARFMSVAESKARMTKGSKPLY